MGPLSAPGAILNGEQMRWAFLRAQDDVNATCGVTIAGQNYAIEIIIGDSEGLPEPSQAVAERMVSEDGVIGIVGVLHSAVALATMSILQDHEIPTIYAIPWNDNITANDIQEFAGRPARISTHEDGVDYIFRLSPASSMTSKVTIDWLLHLGVKDVVIVAENTAYGVPAAEKDKELLLAGGLTEDAVEIHHIEQGQENFQPRIDRILARPNPPDAIKIQITGKTSFRFANQIAEAGLAPSENTICVVNQNAYQSVSFWQAVPGGNYCAFFRIGIPPSLLNPLAQELAAAFYEDTEDEISNFALASYDAVRLLTDAITRANSLDGAAIALEMERSDVALSQGRYYFPYTTQTNSPLEDGLPAWMWHQWPDPAITMMQYFIEGQPGPEAAVVWPPVYWTHGTALIPYGTVPGN